MHPALKILVLGAAAATAAPEIAAAQQPTLALDRGCYTEQQPMHVTGTGYTPGGPIDLTFALETGPVAAISAVAGAGGALDATAAVQTAGDLLPEQSDRETIYVTANDRTRIDADQQPPESQFGAGQFTFTRWWGSAPARFVAGKRAKVQIYGWAFAAGKIAWVLFRKRSRTVAVVKIGRLDRSCGDRTARIKVPRRTKTGRYRVVLTTDRRLRGPYTWRSARVVARP